MSLRAAVAVGGIVVLTLMLMPIQIALIKLRSRHAARLPLLYHRTALRLIGVRLRIIGQPANTEPVLYVSNHVSWLDIPVLGALLPASFIAKREVGGWGPFGTLARLQRTIFVDRERRSDSHRQTAVITDRLRAGDNLVLFAEGTSTDGSRLRPFKSALFAAAQLNNGHDAAAKTTLTIQPVTVAYRAINGVPLTRATRPLIGWYGDMDLEPHFINLLGLGRISADIHFHPPVDAAAFASRKDLAQHCWTEVRNGLLASRGGATGAPQS